MVTAYHKRKTGLVINCCLLPHIGTHVYKCDATGLSEVDDEECSNSSSSSSSSVQTLISW